MRKTVIASILFAAALGQAQAAEGKLVLHTSQPNTDARQTVDAFMDKNAGVTVEWVRDGAPNRPAARRIG